MKQTKFFSIISCKYNISNPDINYILYKLSHVSIHYFQNSAIVTMAPIPMAIFNESTNTTFHPYSTEATLQYATLDTSKNTSHAPIRVAYFLCGVLFVLLCACIGMVNRKWRNMIHQMEAAFCPCCFLYIHPETEKLPLPPSSPVMTRWPAPGLGTQQHGSRNLDTTDMTDQPDKDLHVPLLNNNMDAANQQDSDSDSQSDQNSSLSSSLYLSANLSFEDNPTQSNTEHGIPLLHLSGNSENRSVQSIELEVTDTYQDTPIDDDAHICNESHNANGHATGIMRWLPQMFRNLFQ